VLASLDATGGTRAGLRPDELIRRVEPTGTSPIRQADLVRWLVGAGLAEFDHGQLVPTARTIELAGGLAMLG
jgi:hypothetical protein